MASQTTAAGRFFEDFKSASDRYAFLSKLFNPSDPQSETDWLDFKAGQWQDPKKGLTHLVDGDIKRLWGKALSAFANTQGGVLVFGIDARKNAHNVDAATAFALVRNPTALKSRLFELHHQATDPPVLGVEIEAWESPTSPGEGAVLCHVPESPHRPHRAELDRQYYIRVGDDFVVPAVSILRHLFYPYTKVDFWVQVCARYAVKPGNGKGVLSFQVELGNHGTATAVDTFMSAISSLVLDVVRPQEMELRVMPGWDHEGNLLPQRTFSSRRPLHPMMGCAVFQLDYQIAPAPRFGTPDNPMPNIGDEISFHFQVMAANCKADHFAVRFTPDDFRASSWCLKHGERRDQ